MDIIRHDLGPVRSYVLDLPVYVPGRSKKALSINGRPSRSVQLASNENPLGCSPAVIKALIDHLTAPNVDLARYPDSEALGLRTALAAHHGVPVSHVVITNGSHELVDLCAAISLTRDTSGVFSQYAFQAYPISIRARGASFVEVPARNFGHDSAAMCSALGDSARLVYICNPNNPTGTLLSQSEIEQVLNAAGQDCLVVLDEAYIDFLKPSLRPDWHSLVMQYPNLVIARTFSKAYGLASLRVGYGIMQPELATAINRVRPTFSVNALAQIAALAALSDQAFLERTYRENMAGIEAMTSVLIEKGIDFIPSSANFITMRIQNAKKISDELFDAGIVGRPLDAYGLEDHIRVTIGTKQENELFLDALFKAICPS